MEYVRFINNEELNNRIVYPTKVLKYSNKSDYISKTFTRFLKDNNIIKPFCIGFKCYRRERCIQDFVNSRTIKADLIMDAFYWADFNNLVRCYNDGYLGWGDYHEAWEIICKNYGWM